MAQHNIAPSRYCSNFCVLACRVRTSDRLSTDVQIRLCQSFVFDRFADASIVTAVFGTSADRRLLRRITHQMQTLGFNAVVVYDRESLGQNAAAREFLELAETSGARIVAMAESDSASVELAG